MAKERGYCSAFQSDIITLTVGPGEEKFTIHQDIVAKARYFAGCLKSSFQESHTKTVKLPEDDPAVISKILDYLYSGQVEVATFKDAVRSDEERLQYVLLAKTYVAVDKYCMETLQNKLVDAVRKMNRNSRLSYSTAICVLTEAGLRESPMACFLLLSLARALFKLGYEQVSKADERFRDLIKQGGAFADELMRTCITFGSTEELDVFHENPDCEWHVHSDGKKCTDRAK